MPPTSGLTPRRFNLLPEYAKTEYAEKAIKNNKIFNVILEWLKDTSRVHNQEEDELIILFLHSRADTFNEEGIPLPPPFISKKAWLLFESAEDRIMYMQKYAANPGRPATEEEKQAILSHAIVNSLKAETDGVINAILDSQLFPLIEHSRQPFQIFNILEKLQEPTVLKMLDILDNRGYFNIVDKKELNQILDSNIKKWTSYKKDHNNHFPDGNRNITFRQGDQVICVSSSVKYYNAGIKNNQIVKNYMDSIEIHKAFKNAKPTNMLYNIPMNVAGVIGEFATGIKPRIHNGGRRITRKRVRKILRGKSRRTD